MQITQTAEQYLLKVARDNGWTLTRLAEWGYMSKLELWLDGLETFHEDATAMELMKASLAIGYELGEMKGKPWELGDLIHAYVLSWDDNGGVR